ncbi:SPATS2-like protein [Centruroides sculpturatus]|uniref:SPATS2-like protein n=1 Tax=Centruroides sculpturatus TaxID=218467 RepID=UPI000C6D43E0|nr:SPATS2-like protein [Centruroides sculpturatus]
MEKVKRDARQLLTQRQELAVELKKRAERASTLSENDLNELRIEIKHFVVERKYDDELGRTLRFIWDRDKMTEEIRNFGEVNQVKNYYSQRRYSVSSVASSTNPEPVEPPPVTDLSVSVSSSEKSEEPIERKQIVV